MAGRSVQLHPIGADELPDVGHFLHHNLNRRLSPAEWSAAAVPPWPAGPNHGFMLTQGAEVVGANLAFYSDRVIEGRRESFCNLAALCVREDLRMHTFRLIRALIGQRGFHFTDLSPSGNVVEIDRRLGFRPFDTQLVIAPPVPVPWGGPARLVSDPESIEEILRGRDQDIFRDHRTARAAHHLVVVGPRDYCYLVYRKDARRRVRAFASILHLSRPGTYAAAAGQVSAHLLRRHGVIGTLVDSRLLGGVRLATGIIRPSTRPKMFRSASLEPSQIDYLYSELTCVAW